MSVVGEGQNGNVDSEGAREGRTRKEARLMGRGLNEARVQQGIRATLLRVREAAVVRPTLSPSS
jgi:hypothetical protein